MKPITDEIVQELRQRGISLDQYCGDAVVKALLDADFDHDYVLKSIDAGDINSFQKSKYTEKEEIRYDEKKSGEHERRDYEEGKRAGEKEEKKRIEEDDDDDDLKKNKKKGSVEKSIESDLFKSQQEFFSDLRDIMGEMKDVMKSMQEDIGALKNQPAPFRTVNQGAILEKSYGVKTEETSGHKILSMTAHREPIKKVLTECFEQTTNPDLKKSLASDIMSYTAGGAGISPRTIELLKKNGIDIVE